MNCCSGKGLTFGQIIIFPKQEHHTSLIPPPQAERLGAIYQPREALKSSTAQSPTVKYKKIEILNPSSTNTKLIPGQGLQPLDRVKNIERIVKSEAHLTTLPKVTSRRKKRGHTASKEGAEQEVESSEGEVTAPPLVDVEKYSNTTTDPINTSKQR